MGASYLVVVDMQNDFVSGALGTPEAQAIVNAVVRKVEEFTGRVVFTLDTHNADYLSTQEGRNLPVEHCIEGTWGWQLVEPLERIRTERGYAVYRKPTFASIDLARDLARAHEESPIERIELVGLCTDICVVSNALAIKGFLPETPLSVAASCCAGVTPEADEAPLGTMGGCQVEVIRPEAPGLLS